MFLGACGGGGGGDSDYVGGAEVSISAQPATLDPGDWIQVSVRISKVHKNGIALKIRFPEALKYSDSTSVLTVNNNEFKLTPTVNASDGRYTYLVYFLSQDYFGQEGTDTGDLVFELKALESYDDGEIGVDVDVDDPTISNDSEFNVNDPEFYPDDAVQFRIRGSQ